MNTAFVAIVIVLLVGVGIYIAGSGLWNQYAVDTSGGRATDITCGPDAMQVSIGTLVRFSASGVPSSSLAYWSSPDGASQTLADGSLQVRFGSLGSKRVYLFIGNGTQWSRTSCSVTVAQ